MATLYVAEFSRMLTDADGKTVMAPHYPPVAPEQTVAITGSSGEMRHRVPGRAAGVAIGKPS
jgi:hypothetical protein